MKASKASVDSFLSASKMAVTGVSRDPKKFGFQVFKALKDQGKNLYPIHPEATEIDGVACSRSLASLPGGIDHLVILTAKNRTEEIVRAAGEKNIRNIWIQQMSDTPAAVEAARAFATNLVTGECIFMHLQPVTGIHKFHRAIRQFFGRMPK